LVDVRAGRLFGTRRRRSGLQRYRRTKKALAGPSAIAFSAWTDDYVLRLSIERMPTRTPV
jgi:hypothetical protein